MRRLVGCIVVVGFVIAACSTTDADISGVWIVDKAGTPPEMLSPSGQSRPWIEVSPAVAGHTGCNGIQGDGPPPTFDGARLSTVNSIVQAVGCADSTVAAVEDAFLETLWHPDGIGVAFSEDDTVMHWESPSGVRIDLRRAP